jgi:hypothetical protein
LGGVMAEVGCFYNSELCILAWGGFYGGIFCFERWLWLFNFEDYSFI